MKLNRLSLAVCLASLIAIAAMPADLLAQQTVRGRVTNANTGQALAGVQVVVVGTNLGTLTNDAGRFTVSNVPADAETVRFRRIGFATVERSITDAAMQVQLTPTAVQLEGVTVTAMGIERQRESLGYDVQSISGQEVVDVPEGNFLNSLQGKISGANITSSSYPGGSTRITLRGESSLTGDNQPLIVIDGVPLTESQAGGSYGGGFDYGNAANMINPNNISSINILKGPSAAALYGSRASNGAIVIETQSGRASQSGWHLRQTVEFTEPLRLPDYQNRYGQGGTPCAYTAEMGCAGAFRWVNGAGAGTYDFFDESWGPEMNGQPVDQWYAADAPFDPAPGNVANFFETGVTSRTNISFSASGETLHGRVGLSYENMQGMAPGNAMQDFSTNVKGGLDITENLSTTVSAQYMREVAEHRPGTGYSGQNIFQQFVWFGRQVETERLKDWQCEEGDRACEAGTGRIQRNWNYNYHDNPYLLQRGNGQHDENDRIIGNVDLSYDVNEWLTGTVMTGIDWFRDHRKFECVLGATVCPNGSFSESTIHQYEVNTRARLQARDLQLSEDFSLTANVGGNIRDNHHESTGVSVGRLNVPGVYTVNNAAVQPDVNQFTSNQLVYSLFADAQIGFRDYAFVTVTGRNDWSSTLPEGNRSYFYPSVSGSFVFTDALGIQSDVLTYGKLRGGWSLVGNDTDPYRLQQTYSIARRWQGTPGYTVPNQLPNLNLEPEETEAWEAGIDLEFMDGRLAASYTYYRQTTRRQIMPIQVSATTGYTGQVTNAGTMRNTGHEVQVQARPVDAEQFSWDVRANWSMNDNRVVDLAGDLETLVLGGVWEGTVEARVGEPYGQIMGLEYPTTEDGTPILTENAFGPLPARDGTKKVLADSRPDWTANLTNTFRYGPVSMSLTFDGQMGGAMFSTTKWFGMYTGVLQETLRGRENGACDPGIQLEGVNSDGEPVSGTVCPQAYYENFFNSTNKGIVDKTYVKLRNARIGYQFPSSLASSLGFSQLSVAVIGKNLWMASEAVHVDPDFTVRSDNLSGAFEHGQFPTGRTVGMTISVTP